MDGLILEKGHICDKREWSWKYSFRPMTQAIFYSSSADLVVFCGCSENGSLIWHVRDQDLCSWENGYRLWNGRLGIAFNKQVIILIISVTQRILGANM